MSITIGMGYSTTVSDVDFFSDLESLAQKYGYGLLKGINYAESDVIGGLRFAQINQGWEQLVFLQSPRDHEVSLAYGIDEELTARETKGQRPQFFDFLIKLAALCSKKCSKLGIFFAGEWGEKDRVRFSYGSMEDLIVLLSMPGHWGLRYLNPATGRLHDSDETPLLFDCRL